MQKAKEAKPKAEPSKPSGQSRTMGQLPPSDSEEGSGDESSGDDGPSAAYLNARPAPRKKEQDDAPDPRQVGRGRDLCTVTIAGLAHVFVAGVLACSRICGAAIKHSYLWRGAEASGAPRQTLAGRKRSGCVSRKHALPLR